MSIAHKWKKLSDEHKNKIRISKLGDKNPAKRDDVRKKISNTKKWVKNPKHSEFMRWRTPWNKWTKWLQIAWNKWLFWENSHSWQWWLSFEPYSKEWMKSTSEYIRRRDNYMCAICWFKQSNMNGIHKKLDVHHINYDKKDCSEWNLITLCKHCHWKTNFRRDEWIKLFSSREM